MTSQRRTIQASPETIWEVLGDGWLYPLWVVGASRMREVDEGWPAVGTRLHHSVGTWPALIDDTTEVIGLEPLRSLSLHARGWPMGTAEVVVTLEPSGFATDVVISEDAVSGPGALVPRPVRSVGLRWRNAEALRRLAYVCENRP